MFSRSEFTRRRRIKKIERRIKRLDRKFARAKRVKFSGRYL